MVVFALCTMLLSIVFLYFTVCHTFIAHLSSVTPNFFYNSASIFQSIDLVIAFFFFMLGFLVACLCTLSLCKR